MFVNCPNETVLTDPFMPTLMDEIVVTDNSGADRSSLYITVSIAWVHLYGFLFYGFIYIGAKAKATSLLTYYIVAFASFQYK